MPTGNNGVRRGPDLKPRTRRAEHGHNRRGQRSPTYNSWSQMLSRCTNPKHPRWDDWGGRGITVCDRWRDFANFLADMGERPPGFTIERRDNERGYEPDNCFWTTVIEQNRNRRTTKLNYTAVFEIQALLSAGKSIGVIARETGIERHTVGAVALTIDALHARPPVTTQAPIQTRG